MPQPFDAPEQQKSKTGNIVTSDGVGLLTDYLSQAGVKRPLRSAGVSENSNSSRKQWPLDDIFKSTEDKAWSRISLLMDKRKAVEDSLAPAKKDLLLKYRISMSTTQDPRRCKDYQEMIDDLDPNLGRINAQLVKLYPDISRPIQPLTDQKYISCISGRSNTQPLTEFHFSPLPGEKGTDISTANQDNWYAPYVDIHNLARKYSLSVDFKRTGDEVTHTLYVPIDGQKKLLSTDTLSVSDNLPNVEAQIRSAIEAKGEALQRAYHVRVSKPGQEAMKQWVINSSGVWAEGKTLKTRLADVHELYGIEQALETSKLDSGSPKLNIYFLDEAYLKGASVLGEYHSELGGNPTVVLVETKTQEKITDDHHHDVVRANAKETTIHEMVHHEQHINHFWDNNEFIERMGWCKSRDSSQKWLLKGKNGEYFSFMDHVRLSDGIFKWLLCDEEGKAVSFDKKRIENPEPPIFLANEEVRQRALVTPPDWYFFNACEMHARAEELFRSNASSRSQLLLGSKDLYQIIKEDNSKKLGKVGKMRMPDGSIAALTPDNEKIVADFEKAFVRNSDLAQLLPKPLAELEKVKSSYAAISSPNSQSAERVKERFEKLIESMDGMKIELDIAQAQLKALKEVNGDVRVRDDIAKRSETLKQYQQLRGETYAHYAAFELINGNRTKAEQYLTLAQDGGFTSELNLAGTGLTDEQITLFSSLKGVKKIDFTGTKVADRGFSAMVSSSTLESLSLDGNKEITDVGLSKLGQTQPLKTLTLRNLPNITSLGISNLPSAQTIEELEIKNCPITAEGIMHVGKLKNLRQLNLAVVNIGDRGLSNLRGHEQLTVLKLSHTNISDASCKDIASINDLWSLQIDDPISDAGLNHLQNLPRLSELGITSKNVTGKAFSALAKMPELGGLSVSESSVTANALMDLRTSESLHNIFIQTNQRIPEEQIKSLRRELRFCVVRVEQSKN